MVLRSDTIHRLNLLELLEKTPLTKVSGSMLTLEMPLSTGAVTYLTKELEELNSKLAAVRDAYPSHHRIH